MYSLFDEQQGGLRAPDPRCLNLVGQPDMTDTGLAWAIRSDGDFELFSSLLRSFELGQPILFRDPESGSILAAPAGASGGLVIKPQGGGEGWERHQAAIVLFDRGGLVVIDRRGRHRELSAMLSIEDSGVVRLCAVDRQPASAACGPEDSAQAGLPYEYRFMRCEPGCDQWCAPAKRKLPACGEPPAAECIGQTQRQFLGGKNVGGVCLYEEWDFECAKQCEHGRCDSQSPTLKWSLPLARSPRAFMPVSLGGGVVATLAGNEVVAVSADGKPLWRERLSKAFVFSLSSDGQGRAFTLDKLGNLRALGKSRWEARLATTAHYGSVTFVAPNLYATWGTMVFAYDPATGQQRWRADIGREMSGGPVPGPSQTVSVLAGRDIVLFDVAGTIRSRVTLPEKPLQGPAFTATGEILVATDAGRILFGPLDALRPITSFSDRVAFDPVLSGDRGALFITRGSSPAAPNYTIHRMALPSGRESWQHALGWVDRAPLVDGRGNIIVLGESVLWLKPDGTHRFSLDLRSGGGRSANALLEDGILYLLSHARLSALDL